MTTEGKTRPETWLDPEEYAYPRGGFTRRGRARVTRNRHNPIVLPYGEIRAVRVSIPESFSTIPARLRYRGKTVKGYVTHLHDSPDGELSFVPEADSTREHSTRDDCRVAG